MSSHPSFPARDGALDADHVEIGSGRLVPAPNVTTDRLVATHRDDLSRLIAVELERFADEAVYRWPAEPSAADDESRRKPDVDRIVASIDLGTAVQETLRDAALDAFRSTASAVCERLEAVLEEHADVAPGVATLSMDVDPTGTHASEALRRRVARAAAFVEETVRRQVRDALRSVTADDRDLDGAVATLRERTPEIADDHARVLARIEARQAPRDAVAAVAAATDLVVARRWRASERCEAYPWHAAMNGAVAAGTEPFVVPAVDGIDRPGDYPRATFVVGADRPFDCRCGQDLVLAADLPTDVRALDSWAGVDVDCQVTDKQYGLWRDHARDGEDVAALLERIDAAYSRTRAAREFCDGSKSQYYGWLDEFGLK